MMWLFAIVVVIVLGGVAVIAAGRGEPMAPAFDDRPDALVPAGRPLSAADLRGVRFSVALRGYRMSEVDALLARLGAELDARTTAGTTDEVTTDPADAPDAADAPDHSAPTEARAEAQTDAARRSDLVDPPSA